MAFTRLAWGVLVYNIFVILWGAVVRATGSGAGCGSHWPLCNGEVVPRAPAVATAIELAHRLTSGLALIGVVVLCWFAFKAFERGSPVRLYSVLSLIFILIEALLGAGLVLLEYVDQNRSIGRAIYLSAHLVNTQILLATLTLAAWYARPKIAPLPRWSSVAWILPAMLIVGVSGAIAALGDTLFPARTFAEGVREEMSSTAHILLRLRVFHPGLAIAAAALTAWASLKAIKAARGTVVERLAWCTLGLTLLQLVVGAVNVLLLAPVWMQILHLALADVLWIAAVLLAVEAGGVLRSASDARESALPVSPSHRAF